MEEITLSIGQKYKLKGNIFTKNYTIVYTGMISEDRFSLGIIFSEGYQALSYNLFFKTKVRNIDLEHAVLDIFHIDDHSLRCRITKK
ncbi:MAG: hypothetical protein DWP97_02435 [Calditrichaeota bacterium]|nr:MAG: hypothetical protein DWP97_02435 [Calditrichota bacterium]